MALSILYGKKYAKSQIGTVIFDTTVMEEHKFSSRITNYPIENGTIISDHIINDPDSISLSGIVSDTPINILASSNRSIDAFNKLVDLHRKREVFDVVTGIRVYRNMAITTLNIPRNIKTGQSLTFNIELQRIIYSDPSQIQMDVTNIFSGVTDRIYRDYVASNADFPLFEFDPNDSLRDQAVSMTQIGIQSLIPTPSAILSNVQANLSKILGV